MPDVIVVGAGLAGLVCAEELTRAGVECVVLEASDGPGGRVRSDAVDGFVLDRGFQIVLTAYPQVQQRFDLAALDLAVRTGGDVRRGGSFHRVADPLRRPQQIPQTLAAPIGSLADKLRLAALVVDVRRHSVRELLRRPDITTAARLSQRRFSPR